MKWALWTGCLGVLLLMVVDHPGHTATISVGEGLQYDTLSSAILDATNGDVLLVSPGVYDSTRGETFPLTPKATITIRAASEQTRPVIQVTSIQSVFLFSAIEGATLDGLEIHTGSRTGIQIQSSTVEVLHSRIQNNTKTLGGEVFQVSDSHLSLEGCSLEMNISSGRSGGIICTRSKLSLTDCEIHADAQNSVLGAAIFAELCPEITFRNTTLRQEKGINNSIVFLRNQVGPEGSLLIEDCTLTEAFASFAIVHLENYNAEIRNLNLSENSGSQSPNPTFAFFALGGTTRMTDSVISNNVGIGGALVESGTLVVENCKITGNHQDGLEAEYLYVKNSMIGNNSRTGVKANHFWIEDTEIADNGYAGLNMTDDPLTLEAPSAATDTIIRGNGFRIEELSTGYPDPIASGIHVGREACFKRCEIVGNSRKRRGGSAGIYATASILFEDCLINHNSSADTNAALFCVHGDAVVSRCQIVGNSIDPDPTIFNYGAIRCGSGGRIFLLNTVIAGNTMWNWPLISASANSAFRENGLFFFNCTIEGNHRPADDTPLIWTPGESFLRMVNTIVWNGGANLNSNNLVVSHSNTDDQIYPGPGNISEDPLFFQPWDGTSADYRLPCNSPSVDSGTSEGAPAVDITGGHRPRGTGVDMGAYENCILDFNGDGMESGEDLLFFPTEWYEDVNVDNKIFDFVTGPSIPNRIDSADLLHILEAAEER